MKEVYILFTEYSDFEDNDYNYTEIWSVFETKEKAFKKAYKYFLQEIDLEMRCNSFIFDEDLSVRSLKQSIKHQLESFGYIKFSQDSGNGKATLVLKKEEIK